MLGKGLYIYIPAPPKQAFTGRDIYEPHQKISAYYPKC